MDQHLVRSKWTSTLSGQNGLVHCQDKMDHYLSIYFEMQLGMKLVINIPWPNICRGNNILVLWKGPILSHT